MEQLAQALVQTLAVAVVAAATAEVETPRSLCGCSELQSLCGYTEPWSLCGCSEEYRQKQLGVHVRAAAAMAVETPPNLCGRFEDCRQ